MSLKSTIEAALFLSDKPLSLGKLADLCGTGSMSDVIQSMDELVNEYNQRDSGLEIGLMGQAYKMQVRQDQLDKVKALTSFMDLSRAEINTLAYVVFKQPVKQSEVVDHRGSVSYKHIKKLLKLGMLRAKPERNTMILAEGSSFKRYFGGDAVSIKRMAKE